MRRVLITVATTSLMVPGLARADIGIVTVSTTSARPGDVMSLVAEGYLGSKPWRSRPLVMIPVALAPRCCASPRARLSELRPPRYRIIGAIRHWRLLDGTGVNARGRVRFRVPTVIPGRYLFGLFCGRCAAGDRGSVIIDRSLVLRIRR